MVAPSTSSRGDQVRCWRHASAPIYSSQLCTEVALLFLGSLAIFCCLVSFWGATSHSSSSCTGLFFFRFGITCSLRSVGGKGGRRRKRWRNLGLGNFFWSWPLVPCGLWALLGPCSPSSMPSRLPLLQKCCLDGQSPKLGREHLSAYQACPRRLRCELLEPIESPLL